MFSRWCKRWINKSWKLSRNYIQERLSQIYANYALYSGRNVNKPSALAEVEGKGLKLCDITVQQKPSSSIKFERILMIFGFLVNIENTIAIYSYSPLGPFSLKNDALPWILCFDLHPLQYTDLKHHIHIWRFLVYIFLGSHVPVLTVN